MKTVDLTWIEVDEEVDIVAAKKEEEESRQLVNFSSEKVLWRLPPHESCSDLAIHVTAKRSKVTQTYHVHRINLILGENKCGLLEKILRDGGRKELANSKSVIRIELNDNAAEAFPWFIDFIYTGKNSVHHDLSATRALDLLHLADQFRVQSLIDDMQDYLMENMALENLRGCMPLILTYRNDESMMKPYLQALLLMVEAVLRKHPHLHDIIERTDVTFMVAVLRMCSRIDNSNKTNPSSSSSSSKDGQISRAAVQFLATHEGELSIKELKEITSESHMGYIAPEVAIQFLEIESQYYDDGIPQDKLTSLQTRCIDTLVRHDINNLADAERIFKNLPPKLISEFATNWLLPKDRDSVKPSKKVVVVIPHQIKVLSVHSDLSGTYELNFTSDDAPNSRCYKMDSKWKGKPATFQIFQGEGEWCLGYKYLDDHNFRVVSMNYQCSDILPPSWGWCNTKAFGNVPIFILFGHQGDDSRKKLQFGYKKGSQCSKTINSICIDKKSHAKKEFI